MEFLRYVFHMCTMNTNYRVNFPIVSKSMCIHLLGDSNTKCTHLGGVHPNRLTIRNSSLVVKANVKDTPTMPVVWSQSFTVQIARIKLTEFDPIDK